ncbi:hypothetical protein KOW79_002985 [Hemibagrus wyckioides]|uniref:Uncharacterized protein n=1 Tax=Hemibagrus wyckioides TaxID=337641 RepID=A0A9D3P4F0_9TELE|nr:hypothetical protein KOW79_002985 [Hemibagrus wyckioides]
MMGAAITFLSRSLQLLLQLHAVLVSPEQLLFYTSQFLFQLMVGLFQTSDSREELLKLIHDRVAGQVLELIEVSELSPFADATFSDAGHGSAEGGVPCYWIVGKEEQVPPYSVIFWSAVVRE